MYRTINIGIRMCCVSADTLVNQPILTKMCNILIYSVMSSIVINTNPPYSVGILVCMQNLAAHKVCVRCAVTCMIDGCAWRPALTRDNTLRTHALCFQQFQAILSRSTLSDFPYMSFDFRFDFQFSILGVSCWGRWVVLGGPREL